MALDIPQALTQTMDGPKVFIRSVEDMRVFEDRPSKPSIPSLGYGGKVETVPEGIKARAIARKRNSYGMAMGDILLPEGQTVAGAVHGSLKTALVRAGYTVVSDETEAGADGRTLDVDIERFWAWFTPGMWKISLDAWISTPIKINRGGTLHEMVIEADSQLKGGSASAKAWRKVYQILLDRYVEEAVRQFRLVP
jgi:hypothetical protein